MCTFCKAEGIFFFYLVALFNNFTLLSIIKVLVRYYRVLNLAFIDIALL